MIIVHHLNNSRSQRILWLLEELNVPYQIKRYERNKKTMLAPPELKHVHPLGKSPVLDDDGLIVAESGAIIEYLVGKYGNQFRPLEGTPEFLKYTYWLHFAEGSAMPYLLLSLIFNKIESTPAPFFIRPIIKGITTKVKHMLINPNLKNTFEFIEEELRVNPWFAGKEFTAADIQMSFPMEAGEARGNLLGPKSKAWLEKIHERPAYKRAQEKGSPFKL